LVASAGRAGYKSNRAGRRGGPSNESRQYRQTVNLHILAGHSPAIRLYVVKRVSGQQHESLADS